MFLIQIFFIFIHILNFKIVENKLKIMVDLIINERNVHVYGKIEGNSIK